MTIRYKSETFDLTTTNVTTILTCPSDATIIGKSLQICHQAGGNIAVDVFLQKSGESNVDIAHQSLSAGFENFIKSSLNMEANDILIQIALRCFTSILTGGWGRLCPQGNCQWLP